jgi:hypothetical protein
MNLIEQNDAGNIFSVAYQDMGVYHVVFIDSQGEPLDDVDITEIIDDLNEESLGMEGIYEPFITSVFLPDGNASISVFHRMKMQHYQFTYDFQNKQKVTDIIVVDVKSDTTKNYPVACFYSEVSEDVLTFYRLGQYVTCSTNDVSNNRLEKILFKNEFAMEVGQIYMIYGKCLLVQSSRGMIFFQIEKTDKDSLMYGKWAQYDIIEDLRGQIFHIKGNIRV